MSIIFLFPVYRNTVVLWDGDVNGLVFEPFIFYLSFVNELFEATDGGSSDHLTE